MSQVLVSPTGKLIQGNVLDVARKPFERALRDYDKQLYVKWNPKKLHGWGCWEIRRRPDSKQVVDITEFQGTSFVHIEYNEVDVIHHVLDASFLNYDQLRKLKSIDTFTKGYKEWISDLEYWEKKQEEKELAAARAARDYAAKQFKHEIKDFKEMISSGLNPALLADVWDKV